MTEMEMTETTETTEAPVDLVRGLAYERVIGEQGQPIHDVLAAVSARKGVLAEAKQTTTHLVQTRPQSEWADAEAAELAQAEGRPEPKRTHVARHDREIDEARHQERVAELALRRVEGEADEVIAASFAGWLSEAQDLHAGLLADAQAQVEEYVKLHSRLAEAAAVLGAVGAPVESVAAIALRPRDFTDASSLPGELRGSTFHLSTERVLELLAQLGQEPEPEPAQEPQEQVRIKSPLALEPKVEEERAEREAHARWLAEQDDSEVFVVNGETFKRPAEEAEAA
jgi:hypothetical protein